jgi:hypothetical protein
VANILIAWDNKADAATLTAGSEISTLPATNVQNEHLSKKWHTDGVNSSNLTLDMGSSVACALLGVLGTNLTAAATLRLRASDTDPTATSSLLLDTGTIAAGVKAGYGAAYKSFASTTARYWRLDLTDTSLSNLQVGRLFLGPRWQPTINMELDWSVVPLDESEVEESYGGQEYANERPQRRVLRFALGFMNEAEMYGNPFAMARANGIVRDVLAIPDIDGSYLSEQAVWGRLATSEPLVNDRLGIFRQRFQVRERL